MLISDIEKQLMNLNYSEDKKMRIRNSGAYN